MKQLSIFVLDKNDFFPMMLDNALGAQISYRLAHYHDVEKIVKDLYLKPDIVIIGDSNNDEEKKDAVLKIKKAYSKTEVIIVSKPDGDVGIMKELFRAGIYDYIIKDKEILKDLSNSILHIHTLNTGIAKNRLFKKTLIKKNRLLRKIGWGIKPR